MNIKPGFYVVDPFSPPGSTIVSGPFETAEEAEADRQLWNCADDYVVFCRKEMRHRSEQKLRQMDRFKEWEERNEVGSNFADNE